MKLVDFLKENELTYIKFARKLGVPSTLVKDWIAGVCMPNQRQMDEIRRMTGAKVWMIEDILNEEAEKKFREKHSNIHLRDYLKSQRITISDFAKIVGASSFQVSRWLNGRMKPSPYYLRVIKHFTNGVIDSLEKVADPNKEWAPILRYNLKRYLAENMITQTELAQDLGFSRRYVSGVINGHFRPSKEFMEKLSEVTKGVIKDYDQLYDPHIEDSDHDDERGVAEEDKVR